MSLESVYFISQVVAAVALVGSLVFVGIQIRQVSNQQRRDAKRARETQVVEAMSRMADNEFGPLFLKASQGDTSLSDIDIARYHLSVVAMIIAARSRFEEYQEGILPAVDWHKYRGNIGFWLACPGFRAVYMVSRPNLRDAPDFDAEFAQALAQPVTDRPKWIASSWREMLHQLQSEKDGEADKVPTPPPHTQGD